MGNIYVNARSSIQIIGTRKVYFDPYEIEGEPFDADVIFITHEHFDHFSPEDIRKVMKDDTQFFIPTCMKDMLAQQIPEARNIDEVLPWQQGKWKEVRYQGIPAYNIDKQFHPMDKKWLGYLIEMDGMKFYAMGDTDVTPDAMKVEADVIFVPVGGKYTMDVTQAIHYINEKDIKLAVPIHYSDSQNAIHFRESLKAGIDTTIFW